MKSFMKKVAALVMMLAMVAGVIAVPNVDAKAATDYYLHGYINGADVAGTNYKFENGSLSVTFSSDSYVYINDGSKDYKTEGWLGSGVTSATLKDSSTISNGDKLMVPAGNVVFTLVDNGNGSVTLSYEADFERDPSVTASPVINGEEVTFYYVSSTASEVYLAGTMTNWGDGKIAMTKNGNVFSHTMTLEAGDYAYKYVVNGTDWINDPLNKNVNSGNNIFTVVGATPVETVWYVCGSMNDWTLKAEGYAMEKSGDNYVLTLNLEAGDYEFKINNGGWVTAYPDSNYTFTVDTKCDVTITLTADNNITVTGEGLATGTTEEIPNKGIESTVILYAVLLVAGLGMVAFASKKRFAR